MGDINNWLNEIQENTGKEVETPKEETLKQYRKTQLDGKTLIKVVQDLKMEVETIKKIQMEATLEERGQELLM